MKRILVDGGYIENGQYHFYQADHLGNNRMVTSANAGVEQITHYYPFGTSFADGLNSKLQPNKYNGKELDDMHGLGMYDYLARQLDAGIGRFGSVDPHAENYYPWSPYVYVGNNPMRYIDMNGMDWWEDKDGNPIWYNKLYDRDYHNKTKDLKYLGESYKGISIKQSSVFNSKDGRTMIQMSINYDGEDGESQQVSGFIQTIDTDSPLEGKENQSIDAYNNDGSPHFNFPFYHTTDVKDDAGLLKDAKDRRFNGDHIISFSDRPSRKTSDGDFIWEAETSLIKPRYIGKGGVNEAHSTVKWGFSRKGTNLIALPVRMTSPSNYHKKAINKSNKP